MPDDDLIILGSDGVTEHVFPPAMDPKKAAEIVRTQEHGTMNFAIVNGQKVPLGGDEADLPQTEGFYANKKTGERILQSALTADPTKGQQIAKSSGDWQWNPPPTKDRVDDSMFRVGGHPDPETGLQTGGFAPTPEQALSAAATVRNVVLPVGRAVMGAAPGVASRATAAAAASAPMVKYEVSKRVLMRLGVPELIAAPIASKLSGWEGKSAANKTAAAEADRLRQVKELETAAEAKTVADAARQAAIAANPPTLVKGGGAGTLESALDQELKSMMGQPAAAPTRVTAPVAPGSTMTPGGMPSVGQGFNYQQPSPAAPASAPVAAPPVQATPAAAPVTAAPVVAAPPPVSAAAPAAAQPTTTASVPFMVTRNMRTMLTNKGYDEAAINAMTPQQAHQALASSAPVVAAAPAELTPADIEAFRHIGKGGGLSDQEVKDVVQAAREAAAQRMSALVGSRQAARNLGMTQEEVIKLRGPSPAGMPPERLRKVLDAGLEARKGNQAALDAYVAAAADKPPAVLRYLKFKLGLD